MHSLTIAVNRVHEFSHIAQSREEAVMSRFDKSIILLAAGGAGLWLLSRALRRPDYSFTGKVVLITGGSRGLGLVLARQLTGVGARLAICARDAAELERASNDLA